MKIYLLLPEEPVAPHSSVASVGDGQSWEEIPCEYCGDICCRTTVPFLPRGKKPTVCTFYFGEFVLSSSFSGHILIMCLLFQWLLVGATTP